MTANPARPTPELNGETTDRPVGLAGWLLIPLFFLALTPVVGVFQLSAYWSIFDLWSVLSGGQFAFVFFELVISLITILVVPVLLLFLAYRHSEMFPGIYLIWAGALPVIGIVNAVLSFYLFREFYEESGERMFDRETIRGIGQSIWGAAIWIPYMMLSERVENTFTR